MVLRVVTTVWLPVLLAAGAASEYLDRSQEQVYRTWRGLRNGYQYGCQCDPAGSVGRSCDIRTGQCTCLPHVTGTLCDRCEEGYYDLRSGLGCHSCGCSSLGSEACDPYSGRCRCKPGVGGARCNACLPGFFLFSDTGCLECGSCEKPGHLCDPVTGQCICPPHTYGPACQYCDSGYWPDLRHSRCRKCDCSLQGSVSADCDSRTGRCSCMEGYGGRSCSRRMCQCDLAGTTGCDDQGNCPCDDQGDCPCKKNVRGTRCNQCAPDTFSLSADNPDGCTACFCFTRTNQCSQADSAWVPLTLPDKRAVTLTSGQTQLKVTNSLRVIPGQTGDVTLGLRVPLDTPLYWQLPHEFLGDKVRSYNGQLRFRLRSSGGQRPFPGTILATYPLVQLQGHTRLVLEYFSPERQTHPDGLQHVKFHESLWRRQGGLPVTRELMMTALQNTQLVLIRATESVDTQHAEITDISWDIAEPTYGRADSAEFTKAEAPGIEICACPSRYNGSSCQDPSIGFYRTEVSTESHTTSQIIIEMIGDVTECQCNGRAVSCNPDSGVCQNCTENSAGKRCDFCAAGYYGNPSEAGGCRRCLCPTEDISNADSCTAPYGPIRCNCKPGYYGNSCERCAYGYFGDARDRAVGCVPCACDPAGSVDSRCDQVSGQCRCRAGHLGRDCNSCPPRHTLTTSGCQACQDVCVKVLFEELDTLAVVVSAVNVSGGPGPPWQRLYAISNETQYYDEQLMEYIFNQWTLNASTELVNLEPFANNILMQTKELLTSLPDMASKTRILLNEVNDIHDSVLETRANAEGTVDMLIKYAKGGSSSLSLDEALANATAILENMQKFNITAAQQKAERELVEVLRLIERVESLAINGTAQEVALSKLEDMQQRMQDMRELIEKQARQPVRETQSLLASIRSRLAQLDGRNQTLGSEVGLTEQLLSNGSSLLLQLRRLYDQAQGHSIDLSDLQDDLQRSNASLQQKVDDLSQLSGDFGAAAHADQLTRQADQLESLFQATRQGANLSLAAVNAYQEIVDALQAARQAADAASQAAQEAYRQAYPRNTDSLELQGTKTKAKSEDLRKLSEKLLRQVNLLSDKLDASKKRLQSVNGTIQAVRAMNDDLRRELQQLNTTEHSRLTTQAAEEVRAAEVKEKAVSRRLDVVLAGVDKELRPGLLRLQNVTELDVSSATRLVDEANWNMSQAKPLAAIVEQKAASVRQLDNDTNPKLQLQQIREKVLKARHVASNIRVSLTAKGPSCSRRYRAAELQPSATSSLRLKYSVSQEDVRDALLLYIGARGNMSDDFMAVEMVNRKIRFLWNNGGYTQVVSHPLELGTNNEQLMDDNLWYIIDVSRIGNLGRLTVKPVNVSLPGDTVSAVSTAGFSLLHLTADDSVFIGAPPAPLHRSLATKRFAGCLDAVSINGHPLGLWNFQSTRDCGGCTVSPSEKHLDTTESSFDGSGYVQHPPLRRRVQDQYSMQMWVKTFDTDALLFLVANEMKGQFVSLEMRDGHLVLRVVFSETDELLVKSNAKYNTGNWTRVEATHAKKEVLLVVDDEFNDSSFDPVGGNVRTNFDLDLDESKLYVGGVPPDFDHHRWPQLTFVPLLGCMKEVYVTQFALNLKEKVNSNGVTSGCGGQVLKTGYRGDGYLEINSSRLEWNASFGFSFKTSSSDGLLLISTFAGKVPGGSTDLQEYYSLGLVGGRLLLRINGGKGELLLAANGTFNNNAFHTVSVVKAGRRVELRVADRVMASGMLVEGSGEVLVPGAGGLFLGGLPEDVNVTSPVAVPRAFHGCIQNVILDNSLVDFNVMERYERVAIGRCDDSSLRRGQDWNAPEPAPEPAPELVPEPALKQDPGPASTRCHQQKELTLEDRAVKFGDDLQSHVYQRVSKKAFRKKFNISLSFRTFYPNGLILYNKGKRRKTFFSLILRKGAVVFSASNGSRRMEISTQGNLNDGVWKTVTLTKRKRSYTLQVDGLVPVRKRGFGRLQAGNGLYLGGLPNTSYVDKRPLGAKMFDFLQTERFKGCMRRLGLRNRVYNLTPGLPQNTSFKVGLCYTSVEQGTFFGGDAYATYDESFQLGERAINLAVSFRTSALDGVLFSGTRSRQSGSGPTLALALELNNGEVVFSVQNGGSEPVRARMKFPTNSTICDNRWHNIKAHFLQNQAQLRVDTYPETYGVKNSTQQVLTGQFPLYIGGLPDSAGPGDSILLQQYNFKGCIRKIEINKIRRDWIDMSSLTNVLLNSCPVDQ